ncbi:RNA repair transcriptional activator RtcR family protein [Pelotomaculum isophthalicicum JI]|uniref:RNA repair transcriptional activator RtcR family protein n=1 Tax=Pelotomaculum isophthalicicum JI TaxID=947010 RepID=A0A9X4H4F0_9FIRM|nr:RNA repair transcriptional activator RtcR family protein [Pelotomaculum isophthalicicum]MDF9408703.1 RNA repair transcriptional activator RtcR family protein [Pelotomaculum isophthalicicum JI]
MLKIMLSSVGLHDPCGRDGSEGPVLGAVRELTPDILFLFPTRKQPDERLNSTEENCWNTVSELAQKFPAVKVYVRPLNLPDPTDYADIIKSLKDEVESIKQNYAQSDVKYFLAISSGTPQIQSAFLVLVNSNRIKAEVYQTINPAFLREGEKHTRLVETHFLEEENQIVRARRFFRNINYEVSSDELFNLGLFTIYPDRAQKAEIFYDLIKGYFYWDLYQHNMALIQLKKVQPDLSRFRFDKLSAIVSEQIGVLQQIIGHGQREDFLNLVDLYHNALRRKKCKQYIDCLSRFKRLYEGIYYYVAMRDLGINNPGARIEQQPDWVRSSLNKSGHLNVYDISMLYRNKKGKPIASGGLEQQLNQLGNQRNATINNHGMNSVDEEDARKAIELIEKLFKAVFNDRDIGDFCFSQGSMKAVEELIFSEL